MDVSRKVDIVDGPLVGVSGGGVVLSEIEGVAQQGPSSGVLHRVTQWNTA